MRRAHGTYHALAVAGRALRRHLGGTAVPLGGWTGEMTKGKTMKSIITKLRGHLNEQARFRQIRDEIARMPLDVALDLDIYPGDADRIARKAVWG